MDILTYALLLKKIVDLSPRIEAEVDAWLDDHPEATTTVQDGAITGAKMNSTYMAGIVTYSNGGIIVTTL